MLLVLPEEISRRKAILPTNPEWDRIHYINSYDAWQSGLLATRISFFF
jgi:hypothetical protein